VPTVTSFEQIVKEFKLSPDQYIRSTRLREWARRNKNSKYIPRLFLKLGVSRSNQLCKPNQFCLFPVKAPAFGGAFAVSVNSGQCTVVSEIAGLFKNSVKTADSEPIFDTKQAKKRGKIGGFSY